MPPRSRSPATGCGRQDIVIFVKPRYARKFALRVKLTDTIDIVKQKIHEQSLRQRSRARLGAQDLPVESMELFFGTDLLTKVNSTLLELGIFNCAHLTLTNSPNFPVVGYINGEPMD